MSGPGPGRTVVTIAMPSAFNEEPAYGHTPGMSYYVVESKGKKLVFWGDTMNIPEVQFANPSITIQFDVDSKQAAVQRKKAFADAVKNRYLIALPHMHFPGIGHVQKDGRGYRFIPVPYNNDAQKSPAPSPK